MDNADRGKKIAESKRENWMRYQGGIPPFGYRRSDDGSLVEDELNYKIYLFILDYGDTFTSRALEKKIRELGGGISHTTICKILRNREKLGDREQQRQANSRDCPNEQGKSA